MINETAHQQIAMLDKDESLKIDIQQVRPPQTQNNGKKIGSTISLTCESVS